jgi:hypothetical protein
MPQKTGIQKHREIGESETEKNRREREYHKYREKDESGLTGETGVPEMR